MENRRAEHLAGAAAALGMTSIASQIIILREFVSVFQGNELVIGVVLATWMGLTGGGAFLGRRHAGPASWRSFPAVALLATGALPPAVVALLRALRTVVLPPGATAGILHALAAAAVLLAPSCLLSGFLFASLARASTSRVPRDGASFVYRWESAGSVAGGVLFSIALAALLDTFQALFVLLLIDCAVAFVLAAEARARTAAAAALVVGAGAAAMCIAGEADRATRALLFPGEEIVWSRDTPYGSLTVTRRGEQTNFFENGTPMFSTNDVIAEEEAVHYCMAQRATHRFVLMIGGGISGTTQEALKYGVERIDYAEINPWIIRTGRSLTHALDDGRVSVIEADPRMYVRSAPLMYDAVLVNLPDPATAQINRFYTVEFFRDLRRVMSDSAVVSLSLLGATEYQGHEARRLSSSVYASLRAVFPYVLIVPGERNYYLASAAPLSIGVAALVESRRIQTEYVNRFYIDDALVARRSAVLASTVDTAAAPNRDFRPVAYYQQIAYWLSYVGFDPVPWLAAAALLLLVAGGRLGAVGGGILAGGFAASTVEIVLLVSFQALCGSLFEMTGILITAFMGGLACGAWIRERVFPHPGRSAFIAAQFAMAGGCSVLPLLLLWLQHSTLPPLAVETLVTAATLGAGMVGGIEFTLATRLIDADAGTAAGSLYGLDLAGSAIGALAVSVYVIPLFGLTVASAGGALASAAGGVACMIWKK
ncbi:MAG TPA: hypothetical protein VL221_13325 [Bacteroidota bacterium]|nr:hypothetical protein [Bacteroidota bacterium]